jgi:uncharacterized protein
MPTSRARVPTQSASRYLQQVCKHWSHKFAVQFTPEKGHIPFADVVCATWKRAPTPSPCGRRPPMRKRSNDCSASW